MNGDSERDQWWLGVAGHAEEQKATGTVAGGAAVLGLDSCDGCDGMKNTGSSSVEARAGAGSWLFWAQRAEMAAEQLAGHGYDDGKERETRGQIAAWRNGGRTGSDDLDGFLVGGRAEASWAATVSSRWQRAQEKWGVEL
ncbi:hypothetical protein M0R45_008749 [Rubus argutus]|uniref:Uncharacterized protein n=1 Tax=Rubus argutus TaxID=59490 RepID=A0AAW1Y274_RUBAR